MPSARFNRSHVTTILLSLLLAYSHWREHVMRFYLSYLGPDTLNVEDLRLEVLTRNPRID